MTGLRSRKWECPERGKPTWPGGLPLGSGRGAALAGKMKTTIVIIAACIALCDFSGAQTNAPDISAEIIGVWQSGEILISQPPPEMWQDIKDITFYTNGIVEWSEVKRGKMVEMTGRYMIQPGKQSKRQLPMLFVAPTNYLNPMLSSICLLRFSELQIDFDSRFHVERFGKALKAVAADGKRVVFIKKKMASQPSEAIGVQGSPQPQHGQ